MRCQLHPRQFRRPDDDPSLRIPARSFPTLKNLATLRQPIPRRSTVSLSSISVPVQNSINALTRRSPTTVQSSPFRVPFLYTLSIFPFRFVSYYRSSSLSWRGSKVRRCAQKARRLEERVDRSFLRRNMRFAFGEFLNGRGSLSYSASSRIPFIRTYFVNEVDTVMEIVVQQVDVCDTEFFRLLLKFPD